MAIEREQLEADVLIIGAGPGGLACALHQGMNWHKIKQLAKETLPQEEELT